LKEKKYIELLKDVGFSKEKERYIKNVKYRIVDETEDNYIISRRKNITFSKSKEGELYITGKI
jgi:endonuclease III